MERRRERGVRQCDWWSEGWMRLLKKEKKRKIRTTSIDLRSKDMVIDYQLRE